MTNYNLIAYLVYLPVAILMTIAVSNVLFKNGKIFMYDIFHQKEDIASATNSLFKIGFYLLNIGFAMLIVYMTSIATTEDLIVRLSTKIGGFAIYLGIMLMLNLFLFMKGRRRSLQQQYLRSLES
ncbi:hypothetical protein ACTS9T_17090 [Empedobacter falsenii]|uniref:Uncharacterized protein n=1 Tax=Empedobacter falsenii TaxID=343874 RepID=A0A7H9DQH5_9FLAO|nr:MULTISPECIES: membrane protein [Empedobacter]MDH2207434.1 hypothetical protein [Empedobacter sp. GD03644]MDM1298895.1 hypothetical protein [Empedobacter falsenii]MDM1318688.1 hypothetical protein [Empedobacter falsenii]MDM1548626.1 hypothetical protein [Empedobacter falsenii]QLL57417.1 hypothetical protein FH779_04660 [Empedobacter falsenii]